MTAYVLWRLVMADGAPRRDDAPEHPPLLDYARARYVETGKPQDDVGPVTP